MRDRPLGCGFLGAGDHAARFMVVAVRSEPGSDVAATHGIPHYHTSVADPVNDPTVDVVYVSSDNRLRRESVLAAAAAGKPVICAAGQRQVEHDSKKVSYEGAVAAFNAAVRGEGEPAVGGLDGLRSPAIAAAVRESAREGRAVAPVSA
jgi:predicted dehydrogenase